MRQRRISEDEQPDKLHDQLQRAMIVDEEEVEQEQRVPTASQHERPSLRRRLISAVLGDRPSKVENMPPPHGVPHGVTEAVVYAEDVRVALVRGELRIFFCQSRNYCVLADTISDGDDKPYPPIEDSRLSIGCRVPESGFHSARMRVSINGRLKVHIEQFDVPAPEAHEMSAAGA